MDGIGSIIEETLPILEQVGLKVEAAVRFYEGSFLFVESFGAIASAAAAREAVWAICVAFRTHLRALYRMS